MMLADVGYQSEAIVQATKTSNCSARSDKDVLKQNISVWTAYSSLLTSTNTTKHEWKTLVTFLMQLQKLNLLTRGPGSTRPVCVWLDMNLYKRVLKLTYLYLQLYEDKWIASPGQFHIVLCALRCLGQTVEVV